MKHLLLLIFYFTIFQLHAQEIDKPVFLEKTANGLTRFYFDKNYFLCPKDCEFKFIERVTDFDVKTLKFNGEFRDFAPNGHIVLTGNYLNGKKQGEFKAYHANQELKWTVTFQDDVPVGEWNFYYPDGKPLMVLTIDGNRFLIKSFWNQKAKQKIVNGNGEYDFTLYFESFTELGFPAYRRRGKVVDGLATGIWQLFLVDGKRSTLAREEYFLKGVLADLGEVYYEIKKDKNQIQMFPIDNFNRAELLTYKNCTFDDHSGFSLYLSNAIQEELPAFNNYMGSRQNEFEYQVIINKNGELIKENVTKVSSEFLKPYLQKAISSIYYYMPSFKNGEYVDDTLNISGKLNIDEYGRVDVLGISIERMKAQ